MTDEPDARSEPASTPEDGSRTNGSANSAPVPTMLQPSAQEFAAPLPAYPVFVAYLVMCVAGLLGSMALAVLVAVALGIGGLDSTAISERLQSDTFLQMLLSSPFQVAGIVVALVVASRTRRGARAQLGLCSPRLCAAQWLAVVIGSATPFAISILASSPMPTMGGGEHLAEFWRTLPLGKAVLWVTYIGLVPGMAEELFFRGLMQRRLLARWSPLAAIATTSVLFGLLHVDPPAIAMASVLGLWLGWVAWRTGSIVITMTIHAAINSTWNLMQIVVRQLEPAETTTWWALGAFGCVSLACFVYTVGALRKRTPEPVRRTARDAGAPC